MYPCPLVETLPSSCNVSAITNRISLPVIDPETSADEALATSTRHSLLPAHEMVPDACTSPPLLSDKLHLPDVHDRVPPISSVSLAVTRLVHALPEHLTVPPTYAAYVSMDSKLPLAIKLPECERRPIPLSSPDPTDMLPCSATSDPAKDILKVHDEHVMVLPANAITAPAPD